MRDVQYLNFELLVDWIGDRYQARVLDSPAGQATESFSLPFDEEEIHAVQSLLRGSTAPGQGAPDLQSFGERLFQAVFGGAVGQALERSQDRVASQAAGLRIHLRMTDAPELAQIPWEVLYDPVHQRFLALSDKTPIVRYLELPIPETPLQITPPLRLLMILSSPRDLPPVSADRERETVVNALSPLESTGLVETEWTDTATLSEIQARLRRRDFHGFHFIGHAAFDEDRQEGQLAFENEQGASSLVSARTLALILRDHRPLRLAVLNACEGARPAARDPYAGAAQRLVQQGIPAAVAMQTEILDQAAVILSREFYAALADGYPVDAALVEARKAVYIAGYEEAWAVPVLYTHAPDGRIFRIAGTSSPKAASSETEGAGSGGVHIEIATDGGSISGSTIQFGDVAGGDIHKTDDQEDGAESE
jgi:hypothetical protein